MKLSQKTEDLIFDFLINFYSDLSEKNRMREILCLIDTAPDSQLFLTKLKKKLENYSLD